MDNRILRFRILDRRIKQRGLLRRKILSDYFFFLPAEQFPEHLSPHLDEIF